jgi:hypothetical protein
MRPGTMAGVEDDAHVAASDVQAVMDALFDIRAGVNLLIVELLGEDDDDGPGEEEADSG